MPRYGQPRDTRQHAKTPQRQQDRQKVLHEMQNAW